MATVQAMFPTEQESKENSTTTLQNVELIMIPTYLDQNIVKGRLKNTPTQVETQWLLFGLCPHMHDKNLKDIAILEETNVC